jgi:hypothetical protein
VFSHPRSFEKNQNLKNTGISIGGFLNEPPVEIHFYRRFWSWSPPFYFYWRVITKTASKKKAGAGKNHLSTSAIQKKTMMRGLTSNYCTVHQTYLVVSYFIFKSK